MVNPFQIVKDFEQAVAEYTGAPYCVSMMSCTAALFACLRYEFVTKYAESSHDFVEIPKFTYVGVAQSIKNAGFKVKFRDEQWSGSYDLYPFKIADSARRFTSNMFVPHYKICTSHHWSKILNIGHGGCILHDDPIFDVWARRFRFDGRSENVNSSEEIEFGEGYHFYLLPELAASGLIRLYSLPKHNPDLPNSKYTDLSKATRFKV